MVEITKEEARKIRDAFPSVCIVKTCKAHKTGNRGKYYMSEGKTEMNLLTKLRKN